MVSLSRAPLRRGFFPVVAVLAFLGVLASCATKAPLVRKDPPPRPVVETLRESSDLLSHIRAKMPELRQGMTRSDVESLLRLDRDFRGILTTEGVRSDFRYFYEIGDFELVLSFSLEAGREGSFRAGRLQERREG